MPKHSLAEISKMTPEEFDTLLNKRRKRLANDPERLKKLETKAARAKPYVGSAIKPAE